MSTVESDLSAIVARDHREPHAWLGAHPCADGGVVVRAYRPDATRRRAPRGRRGGRRRAAAPGRACSRRPADGVELPLATSSRSPTPTATTYTLHDPYAFLPTLGDLDLHLAGEGRHEALYEAMGAHLREMGGVAGVGFTVWAPAARSVSVVGDFNGWDGRLHPMRAMGSSGIWELFVPGVPEGARYKYEIRTQDGELPLKADPYASEAEVPPLTASVVHRPRHDWRDGDMAGAPRAPPSRCASRSASTRSTWAPGGATPTTPTAS